MGTSITIDKHTTSLQDWLDIQNKLQQIQFNSSPNTHIMIWKIYIDQLDQSVNSAPIVLDNIKNYSIFHNQECYVVGLVKRQDYIGVGKVDGSIVSILESLRGNVSGKSLEICIKEGIIQGGEGYNGKLQYFTYAYMGKRAKNNIKLAALSYAYKLANLLSSPQRVKVITGGGVFRNKKLQMGSVVPFIKSRSSTHGLNSLGEYMNVHIVAMLAGKVSANDSRQNNSENYGQTNESNQYSLFSYTPKLKLPTFPISQSPASGKGKLNKDIASQNLNKNYMQAEESNNNHSSRPAHVHIPSIKPPLLKLALKPYQDITYEQMDDEQKNQKYDIRATARHELKMQKFSNDCSLILDGLYLSGEKIAKDQKMLSKYKISDIVNCAGDYCPNWFQSMRSEDNSNNFKYKYLTFFLKDSQNQNIECLFYRVIDFINTALSNKRNVLIHCIQGISRSVTFVIAYLIFTNGYDYKKAESFVKDRRGIACPNNGFMVELIQFYKRLHERYDSLPMPRVFLVSSHCQETPEIITARMLKQKLFENNGKKFIGLDERGIYIIQAEDMLYLWVGAKCQDQKKMKKYWTFAQSYIKKLQQFEKASLKVKAIHQGNQGRDFLNLWNLDEVKKQYQNPEYDRLFNQQKPTPCAGYLRKHYQRQQDHVQEEFISRLFVYPDFENGLGVFETEDMAGFCLLVKSDHEKIKVFIWKAEDWASDVEAEGQYLDNVIQQNYASYAPEKIELVEEHEDDPSEEFMSCFS